VIAALLIEIEGESFLDAASTRAGLVVLAAFLLSFLFIRTSARLMRSPRVTWWPGSIKTEGGLHVHHLVFGIVLLLATGFALALQPPSPWLEIAAGAFGVGAGLTLDEYALWLHLEDVYWAEEGRRSVDAVVIAALIGGLILMGFIPFSTDAGTLTILVTTAVVLGIAVVAALKGKYLLGVAGMLVPIVGLVGAIRLAKPESPWARRRYAAGSAKLARATRRSERHARRYQRFQDHLAGAPAANDRTDG
jgi:cell division protein FtsW (lipid II flippase)